MDDLYLAVRILGFMFICLILALSIYGIYSMFKDDPDGEIYDITDKIHLIKDKKPHKK